MALIHLIRHGTTEGNKLRKYYGSTDLPLANEGVDLISQLALSGIYPKADGALYYTSGLTRTEQTFFLIYGCKEHHAIPNLGEYRFGAFEMKTHDELEQDSDYQAWRNDSEGIISCPGGESPTEFKQRVGRGYAEILTELSRPENREKDVVLVCHGGVISLIMSTSFPKEERNIFQWQPEPGRGYSIHMVDGEPISFQDI